eukprot:15475097-Alexandrium_andersonii.AAC.1
MAARKSATEMPAGSAAETGGPGGATAAEAGTCGGSSSVMDASGPAGPANRPAPSTCRSEISRPVGSPNDTLGCATGWL